MNCNGIGAGGSYAVKRLRNTSQIRNVKHKRSLSGRVMQKEFQAGGTACAKV